MKNDCGLMIVLMSVLACYLAFLFGFISVFCEFLGNFVK